MEVKDIYIQLVMNKLHVSEALALAQISAPLTEEEKQWIETEVLGYAEKTHLPEYRQLACKVKARVKSNINGEIRDILLQGGGLDQLDSFLEKNFGLSIYKLYLTQGVEWLESQVSNHTDGNIIMVFEGGPAQELKQSLAGDAMKFNFNVLEVFQSADIHYAQNVLYVVKSKLLGILRRCLNKNMDDNRHEVEDDNPTKRTVFISYSWESENHKQWVEQLALDLSVDFDIIIDQQQLLGKELTVFMENAISDSDKVLIIVTPTYKEKADNRIKGVGYEASLISDELVTDRNRMKFIPIIRKGTKETSYPRCFGSIKGLDMTDDTKYKKNLEILKSELMKS